MVKIDRPAWYHGFNKRLAHLPEAQSHSSTPPTPSSSSSSRSHFEMAKEQKGGLIEERVQKMIIAALSSKL